MNLEGKVFGNRYLLIEEIGGGGMSIVYKAQCSLLNRFVAVKILRQQFTHDSEIIQRFKFEAQSAAKLQHPNIVSIFDVGEENGYNYIVMEYVDGITLKQAIERKGRLVWDETLDYSIQIAAALEQAHKNKIIHRDIKPHNIIINEQGIAKVTDFGIARATNTSSTLTNIGNAIGSVHYFSPEQARGIAVDERSDIYSLGITMYEMLTGVVPFNADSPISVALKHINDPVKPPIERVASLPKGINQMVMKAIRKDPRQRYQSARGMIEDMYRLIKDPETILDEEDVKEKTKRFNTKNMQEMVIDGAPQKNSRRKSIILYSSVIVGGLILMVVAFFIMWQNIVPPPGPSFIIKNYVGQKFDDVQTQLNSEVSWLKVASTETPNDKIPTGTIISQDIPDKNEIKQKGNPTITFLISSGKEQVLVPDYVNMEVTQYTLDLASKGLKFKLRPTFDEAVPKDYIIKISPNVNSQLAPGSEVIIYVSKGPEVVKFQMPELKGLKYSSALNILNSKGLKVGTVTPDGTSVDSFIVSSQFPPANADVQNGDSVDLILDPYVLKSYLLDLSNEGFEFPLDVIVKATPSDTNNTIILNESSFVKANFPLTISNIKVPVNGTTRIDIYVSGGLFKSQVLKP